MQQKKLLVASLATNLLCLLALAFLVHSFGGPRYLLFRLTHHSGDGMSTGRAEMLATLPTKSDAIMLLGDSLIQNGEWAELLDEPRAINRGITGQWSEVLLNRLPALLHTPPETLLLMTGINDLKGRSAKDTAATVARIVAAIRERAPDTTLVVHSVLPVNNQLKATGRDNQSIVALNHLLMENCGTENCQFLDIHRHFTDEEGRLNARYTHDGVHLNGDGYQRWAGLLKTLLRQY